MKIAPLGSHNSPGSVKSLHRLLLVASIILAAGLTTWWSSGSAIAQANSLGVDHDGGAADINAGPAPVAPGGSATVAIVTETPAAGLGAWTVNVMYDPAVVTPTGCTAFGDSSACNLTFSSTQVRFTGIKASGIFGISGLADLTFQAIGSAGQCSALTPSATTWNDPAAAVLPRPLVSSGQICISAPPTPTPSPTPTPTPSPTPTPTPSPTPSPTPTMSAALTATPTREPTPTPTSGFTCDKLPATLMGTNGNDVLIGTRGDDVIVALGGSDVVIGGSGNDRICLGPGNDLAIGGRGSDRVFGEQGNDIVAGDEDADFLDGGDGRFDLCLGGSGVDAAADCEFKLGVP